MFDQLGGNAAQVREPLADDAKKLLLILKI
jgi:hypothetical protein